MFLSHRIISVHPFRLLSLNSCMSNTPIIGSILTSYVLDLHQVDLLQRHQLTTEISSQQIQTTSRLLHEASLAFLRSSSLIIANYGVPSSKAKTTQVYAV